MYKTIIIILFYLISCSNNESVNILKSYQEAHNQHNVEKSLSFYDDSIKFELRGVWIKKGKKEVRKLEEWDSALNSNLIFNSIKVKQDSIFCKVTEKNDWFKAVGIKKLIHDTAIFILKEGLIRQIIAKPSPETSIRIHKIIQEISEWSTKVNDDTISELIKNGQFIYSKESANKWLGLFKKWNVYKQGSKDNEDN